MRSVLLRSLMLLPFLGLLSYGPIGLMGSSQAASTALQVIDGDTLERDGQTLQLSGVDAPELGQWCHDGSSLYSCGRAAAFELK